MLEVNDVLCTLRWNLKNNAGLVCILKGFRAVGGVVGPRRPKIKPVLFGYTT